MCVFCGTKKLNDKRDDDSPDSSSACVGAAEPTHDNKIKSSFPYE